MINPIFCALDTGKVEEAYTLASQLKGNIGGIKLGLEFFLANGVSGYQKLASLGLPIFLDVKVHDIPNTVAGAIRSLLPLRPAFITLHCSGGAGMMQAAAKVAAEAGHDRPKLLGVTVLTSMNENDLAAVGQDSNTSQHVVRLAKLAHQSGIDGVICSPLEIAPLRAALPRDFILMVPGIRPTWSESNDQKRVMTPREAMTAGASYLVIGRPITAAANAGDAAKRITEELVA